MKEIYALFQPEMALAIHNGQKRQTRRPAKQLNGPEFIAGSVFEISPGQFIAWVGNKMTLEGTLKLYPPEKNQGFRWKGAQPGDLLLVRETFYAYGFWRQRHNQKKQRDEWHFEDRTHTVGPHLYLDNPPDKILTGHDGAWNSGWYKRPSLFMPRHAVRSQRLITDIQCQRLQDITEEDAIAEGVHWYGHDDPEQNDYRNYANAQHDDWGVPTARESYRTLWESINGPESWAKNDWVFTVSFEDKNHI